jgi:inosine-uridine nucleoside N-ribohydrolase
MASAAPTEVFVVETDIGRDPDDFLALAFLFGSCINIRAIVVTPGHPDQIASVKFLLRELDIDIPVGSAHPESTKQSLSGTYKKMLERHQAPLVASADGEGCIVMEAIAARFGPPSLFACGPLENTGKYLKRGGDLRRCFVQGGFLPYEAHDLVVSRLPQFEGHTAFATFNFGGCIDGAQKLISYPATHYFIGKNVCHTILYSHEIHKQMLAAHSSAHRSPARRMFLEFAELILDRHPEGKKIHDVVAAACLVNTDMGVWVRGRPHYHGKGRWGTETDPDGDFVLADLDRSAFWSAMASFN